MMTAAAGVVRREARQFARDVGGHGLFNRFDAGGVVDVDAFLQEAHERAHAHAASKQDGDAAVGEVIHGGEAAAVLVVGQAVYDNALLGDVAAMGVAARALVWIAFALASYLLSWLAASVLDTVLLGPAQRGLRSVLGCGK